MNIKKKVIGFDIDGVITDESHPNDNIWHDALCKYMGSDLKRVSDSYFFTEAYDLPKDIVEAFMEEKTEKLIRDVKPMKGAVKTINYLQEQGFRIHLITARRPEFDPITDDWLLKNGIQYTSLIHDDNKAPIAVEKDIELFVEDSSANAKKLSAEGIVVVLLDKYHNQDIEDCKNIIRVNDWEGIKKEIKKYFKLN